MENLVNKIILILIALSIVRCNAQEVLYTSHDLFGIWKYNQNSVYIDVSANNWNNEYYIFNRSEMLCVSNLKSDDCDFCDFEKQIGVRAFGFSNTFANGDIDSLQYAGKYLTFKEEGGFYNSWCCFIVSPLTQLEFFYHECSYLERLPKKAQIVLYDNSRNDHRNYAREFLEYDICGVKNKGCQLLDSLLQPMGITIPKGDIVVVRDTCGDVLQVEYEPERDKYITGYLRKEELEFVQTQE